MPKHAYPYNEEHDFNLTIVKERKRVANMAIEKERKRILDGMKKFRCEFDGVEHHCSYWKDNKAPEVWEIVAVVENFDHDEYYRQLMAEMDYDI